MYKLTIARQFKNQVVVFLKAITFLGYLIISSCGPGASQQDVEEPPTLSPEQVQPVAEPTLSLDGQTSDLVRQISLAYINQIDFDFAELRRNLSILQQRIDSLLQSPTTDTLLEARESWSAAHNSYQQSSLHFYFASHISTESQSSQLSRLAYQMDHWPILAGYIDSVSGYENGGIVHDVNVQLTSDDLREQHGLFDVTEATLGFHVLEFLLWGEPAVESTRRTSDDFLLVTQRSPAQLETGMELSQIGNNRRRQYIQLVVSILIEDLESSVAIWEQARTAFLSTLGDRNSAIVLSSLLNSATTMLTEDLLVRSLYPLLNGEIETALQSPYSQSSESSVAAQLQSLESLLLETPTADGVTLDKVLVSMSPTFEELFYQNLDASKACLILLYSGLGQSDSGSTDSAIEFEVVECINLLTNLIDHLEQIKLTLPAPLSRAI